MSLFVSLNQLRCTLVAIQYTQLHQEQDFLFSLKYLCCSSSLYGSILFCHAEGKICGSTNISSVIHLWCKHFLIPSCLIFQEEISIYMALVFVLEYDVANKMILQYPSVQTFTQAGATEDKFHVKFSDAVLVSDISEAKSK